MTPTDPPASTPAPDRRPGSDPAPFIPAVGEESAPPVPPETFRLFGSRAFLRLWIAQVFSSLGDWVGLFAILGITSQLSNNSALALSLVMGARMLPGFFLATLGGVMVDRFDRRKIMVLCDVGRAALICTLPFVSSLWLLVVASFFIEIMTLLWGPAKDASVPHFVPEDKLASANTLSLVASYGTFPIGAAIASALAVVATWLGGFDALHSLKVDKDVVSLWFDAITYIASAILVLRLPIPKPTRAGDQKVDLASSMREIKEGIRFMRSEPFSRAVIIGLGGGLIGAGAMIPLGTVYAAEVLGSRAQYGVLLTALGTGAALGIFGILALQKRLPLDEVFSWSVVGVGGFLIAAVSFNVGGIAALLIAVVGACAASAYVTGFTLIQEKVADEMRGRTFATLYAVVRLCLLLSLTVSPLFADLFGWLVGLVSSSEHIRVGGFGYSFPGVRLSLWGGGVLTILSGVYARRSLMRYRAAHGEDAMHPSTGNGIVRDAGPPSAADAPVGATEDATVDGSAE
ncbi:MAG: MFS transporter [Acidimicrobiia bacterium]